VTISGGTVTNTNTESGSSTIVNADDGEVNVSGGTVTANGDGTAISNNGEGNVNVSGDGTVTANGDGTAISNTGDGDVNVSDNGTVTVDGDGTAISNTGEGDVNVSGGTVTANGDGTAISNTGDGDVNVSDTGTVTVTGDGTAISNTGDGDVNVSGGTVEATGDGTAISNTGGGDVNVSGGTVTQHTKTVSVGTQSGTLTAGTAGEVTFTVTTANIADGSYPANAANLPAGVTVSGQIAISGNSGTLTLTGSASIVEGVTNTLTLTIDGTTSAAFTLTITIAGGKTDPTVTWPTGLTATVGQTLANIPLTSYTNNPAGTFSWTTPTASVGAAGQQTHSMKFTPTNTAAYNIVTGNVTVTVSASTKTNPAVTWPTGLTATVGQTLANISLTSYSNNPAGTFSWTTPTASVGAAGQRTHNMRFTPTNTADYNIITRDVTITVYDPTPPPTPPTPPPPPSKTNPAVTWPTGLTATVGQTLSSIPLTSYTNNPAGTFSWTTPTTSVGAAGTREFSMTFTPTNTTAYYTVTGNVTVTVTAAVYDPTGKSSIQYYWADGDGSISIADDNGAITNKRVTMTRDGSITFKPGESGYSEHKWTLNGVEAGTGSEYTLSAAGKEAGRTYVIGLTMIKDNKPHFTQITVVIEEN